MTQVSHYVEAPYNGVSQAPPQVRPDNAAEAVEDTYLSVPQGALKRPPFTWQGRLGSHPGTTTGNFELIERAGTDDYFFTLTREAGAIVPRLYPTSAFPRGFEPAGLAPTAIAIEPAAQAYLNAGNPNPVQDLVVTTVEDYTFILNRKVLVGKSLASAPTRNKEGMVWVRQAAYARNFTVTVSVAGGSPVTAQLVTPNGKDTTDANYVDTEVIADTLWQGGTYTIANGASHSGNLTALTAQGFTVLRVGPVIYFQAPAGVDFTIDVTDGQGGTAMLAIKDKIQKFADLPAKAIAGITLRVTQQSSTTADDYFVSYVPAAASGSGVWQETIGPGANLGLDPTSMPVGLVLDAGVWKLKVLQWKGRVVGDEELAPDPDFVGQYLQDIGFWRGRLALTSGEEQALSSAKDPFRFYPETLATITDGDPLLLVSPLPGKGTFSRAVAFDSRLILFADQGQAAVQAQGVLTPSTGSIDVAGAYEYAGPLRPLEVGERLYFLAPRSTGASVVYELVGGQDSEGKYRLTGDDNTAAVPSYVPAGIDRASASKVNYLVVYARSGDPYLYPHLFRYADRQKVQNAWSRWSLPDGWTVGGYLFRNTRLYLLAVKNGEAHLVMADLAPNQRDPNSSALLTHLDWRFPGPAAPYPSTGLVTTVAAPGTADYPEGLVVTGETLPAGVPVWIGYPYTQSITLSTFYALGQDNRPLRSGRLSVRRVEVDVANTGYLRSETVIGQRSPKVVEFTGYTLDSPDSLYDVPPNQTGKLSFGVGGSNEATTITLINDSHLPSSIVGLEWRGELTIKASRV